jgi:hypothetical protein
MAVTTVPRATYRPTRGAFNMSQHDAALLGAVITEIVETKGGVTAPDLVEAATPLDSPIRDLFEWDDAVAGQRWRLIQASYYLRHVAVDVVIRPHTPDETTVPVRALHRVNLEINNGPAAEDYRYVPLDVVLTHDEYLGQVIDDARRAMEMFERRFRVYVELEAFRSAIKPIVERMIGQNGEA